MPTLRDHFQVVAFKTHYKIAIRAGDNNQTAFAKAIVQTSDKVTDKILEENPDAIEQWVDLRKTSQATDEPGKEQVGHGYQKGNGVHKPAEQASKA